MFKNIKKLVSSWNNLFISDDISKLNQNLRPSYGLGFRAIISSLIYRFDLAVGDDGFAPTIFINYPLSLGSLGS